MRLAFAACSDVNVPGRILGSIFQSENTAACRPCFQLDQSLIMKQPRPNLRRWLLAALVFAPVLARAQTTTNARRLFRLPA